MTSSTDPFTCAKQQINQDDGARAKRQRERYVAARLPDFFGDVSGSIPSRVGEHHRDQGEQPVRRHHRRTLDEVRPATLPERKSDRNEQDERRHFQDREHIADNASGPDSAQMDPCHAEDRSDRDEPLRRYA
jgi:hypothetical protein